MISYNTDIFLSNYYNLQSVHCELFSCRNHVMLPGEFSFHCDDLSFVCKFILDLRPHRKPVPGVESTEKLRESTDLYPNEWSLNTRQVQLVSPKFWKLKSVLAYFLI